ncbi:MAG: nitronate monooxygenase [Alphaproteobacteria bacterium]|nr:nitronate monooxygenase [Alphaproteobacteria bacterium]
MRKPFPYALQLPAFCAPMFLVSGPDLVAAACDAGVIGAYPAPNCRTTTELDAWTADIAQRTAGSRAPWALNLITHSTYGRLKDELEIVARHKPPIVITALGSPKPVINTVRAYGGLVFADVVSIKLAKKAVESGVDGLVCVAAGAGGHTGRLSPFAFISAVREFFDGFVVIGGGIADGAGIAGALAAGADLVYMGTRFLAARESLAQQPFKDMVVACGPDDLVISAAVTGTLASWLRPSLIACGFDPDAPALAERNYSVENPAKKWRDMWSAGQGLQKVTAIEPVATIVDRLACELADAVARFQRSVSPTGIRVRDAATA